MATLSPLPPGVKCVLLDIEGTVGSVHFVHQVLFPLAAAALPRFVAQAQETGIAAECEQLRQRLAQERGVTPDALTAENLVETLLGWIREDRKEGLLKAIQGKIWRGAYVAGEVKAHLYPDVPGALSRWVTQGRRVAIFSSGSVEAQKLYFGYSEYGDLTGFLSAYFDTATGPKREAATYPRIAAALGLAPHEVAFFSDVAAELDAAEACGMRVGLLAREGRVTSKHPVLRDFEGV